ncbi:hypothetical protein GCK72_020718 [Caenorhabditis remanei]|uniref:Uncharacterized protein n=1 Tax=Caenorhabditis remanei TaxID=31234 RepID=A0A6A5GG20_CAERE|nr:hypothetical protein GCK72_020718 [Caenorhabditis remanei]KAF1754158.1 hypothetical protein GCK72_020718 [Caenorhabditis remanei]
MSKIYILGLLVLAGAILNLVGVFTPCWLYASDGYESECAGIVPFYSTEVAWFAASSWLMFITVAFTLIIILTYLTVHADVVRHGFSCGSRNYLRIISGCALMNVLLTVSAVTVIGVYLSKYSDVYYYGITYNLGYSAWISVGAGVIFLIVFGLSALISHRDCC